MNTGSAKSVFLSFVIEHFVNRNVKKALTCLTQDVEWFGIGNSEVVKDIHDAKHLLETEVELNGGSYDVSFGELIEKSRNHTTSTIFAEMTVTHKMQQHSMHFRVTATCILEDGCYKICLLHISQPPTPQEETEASCSLLTRKRRLEIRYDLMDHSFPNGFVTATTYPEFYILFLNTTLLSMLGYESKEELLRKLNTSAWSYVHPDDIEYVKEEASRRNGKFDPYEISYRALKKDGGYIWVNQRSQHVLDENGRELVFAYYTDITAQKSLEQAILSESQKYETLVNSIPGGVGLYKMDHKFTPIFFNDRVCELCGMTRNEYLEATQESAVSVFYPDDIDGMIRELHLASAENRRVSYTYRLLQKQGGYKWTHVSGEWLSPQEGFPVLCAVFTDVNEQKVTEQACKESELRYEAAVKSSGINIWEYDVPADTVTVFSNSSRLKKGCHVVPNYIQSTLDNGYVREDSIAEYLSVFDRIKRGDPEVSADLWYKTNNEFGFWCERVTYTAMRDEDGKPIKYFGVGRDVTREKNAEKQYRDELAYREAMQNATMVSIHLNLTQNTILDGKSVFDEITQNMQAAKTAQDYLETIYASLITTQMAEECAKVFNRDALLRSFSNNQTILTMEMSRKIAHKYYWTTLTVHMMKKPDNHDVVAFLYTQDITNEKMMQNVMDAIVETDYDFLVVVDGLRNSAIRYSDNICGSIYQTESQSFEADTHQYVRQFAYEEDIPRVIEELSLSNIIKQLDATNSYTIFYSVYTRDCTALLKKQLRFRYINRDYKIFLMTRTDITDAFEEQERKNKALSDALAIAEHANIAKSEFMSRMSHEIRNPMNAIMGMAEIASHRLDDPQFVMECIEKSQYASKYLLSLINDILDMSKIESGKVELKQEIIDFYSLIDSINTIIKMQAEVAGVHYAVSGLETCHQTYIGDRVRLQQILINLLSNAIKFTKPDGRVALHMEPIYEDQTKCILQFRVSDTGIGMSEAFIPHLFKPFSQEHTEATSTYGGTGLGLAISKNLAMLMGGDIAVESTIGIGSTFRVKVCLIPSAGASRCIAEPSVLYRNRDIDLRGKRILLVEDHELNIMVATRLLENKNAAVEVAVNGQLGVDKFQNTPIGYYDAILMDIRMPVMDGIEAVTTIRNLKRKDAKTIPIIAMTANAFEKDVQTSLRAGMTAHLAKPIDPQLLYGTLFTLLFDPNKSEQQLYDIEPSPLKKEDTSI